MTSAPLFHGALIGQTLGHSFSRRFFEARFEALQQTEFTYTNWELPQIEDFITRLKQSEEVMAFNVTIPYKEAIIPFLSELDPHAQAIGAVNTIVKTPNNALIGYNTDWIGFRDALLNYLEPQHTSALVFGTGGASKAICYALSQLGIDFTLVSRRPQSGQIAYDELTEELAYTHTLWINTTPIGTFPNVTERLDLPYEVVDGRFLLFDLIYNPAETAFLQAGAARGAQISNGYEMLENQARTAWTIWQSHYPDFPNLD